MLNERREHDKVISLLLTLNSGYNNLIKQMLRVKNLPTLEEVCAPIQKKQVLIGLFGGKGELVLANQAEGFANKRAYKPEEKKICVCEKGHDKDKCWILQPHLKPQKFRTPYNDAKAHFSSEMSEPSTSYANLRTTEYEPSRGLTLVLSSKPLRKTLVTILLSL